MTLKRAALFVTLSILSVFPMLAPAKGVDDFKATITDLTGVSTHGHAEVKSQIWFIVPLNVKMDLDCDVEIIDANTAEISNPKLTVWPLGLSYQDNSTWTLDIAYGSSTVDFSSSGIALNDTKPTGQNSTKEGLTIHFQGGTLWVSWYGTFIVQSGEVTLDGVSAAPALPAPKTVATTWAAMKR